MLGVRLEEGLPRHGCPHIHCTSKDWFQQMTRLIKSIFSLTLVHYGPLTPLLTDNYPWKWISECKQVLQVAEWEGSVALVHTHYDLALWV